MKKLFLFLGLLLFVSHAKAQLTERLQIKIQQEPNALQPVSIAFLSSTTLEEIVNSSVFEKMTLSEKQRYLNIRLMAERDASQKNVLEYLQSEEGKIEFKSFYIVNRIVANLRTADIQAIDGLPNIDVMDLALGTIEFDKPILSANQGSFKTAGVSAEPGLVAINAPEMWKLGYTGKGRKVYVYDTGVWSEHPAFNDRYLGNYLPKNQAWYGYFSNEHNGNLGSHGTHVLGTIGGLDQTTSDTIGSAFGSYWMACDLINGSTAGGLPPQAELIAAFEWALNPDGDTSTTSDIPDVINNSWRWLDNTDTTECFGFIPQLMNTIEAAGIANVFSGGNTGPNNSGVRSPQRINTTDVNTFTVGSVNANLPWPHPISSFSTRGPTQCPGSGSLQLFPEVVAPGQNVRSAWGKNGYNSISGTSMASPHVSGALLLLKEAFPNLAGNILLQALYTTAIDMGTVGEDNIYGRGLIDVYAAFQYLSLTHTPHDPNAPYYDIAIEAINENFNSYNCENEYHPRVRLINYGDFPIDSVTLTILVNSSPYSSQRVATAQLQSKGDTMTITPNSFVMYSGKNEIQITVSIDDSEVDAVNNHRTIQIEKLAERNLPFTQDFEFTPSWNEWAVLNEDKWITWDTTSVMGWSGNSFGYQMPMSNYSPLANQKDGLRSPQINLTTSVGSVRLGFDRAYRVRGTSNLLKDSLNIYVSEDCGVTFTKVYSKGADDLKTVTQTGADFVPASQQEWGREYVDLSNFVNKDIVVLFETVNRKGNNLFIDNVSVFEGQVDPLSIDEEKLNVYISPNPVSEILNVSLESAAKFNYEIFDVTGRLISDGGFEDKVMNLNVSQYQPGVYYLSVFNGSGSRVVKFVKQ